VEFTGWRELIIHFETAGYRHSRAILWLCDIFAAVDDVRSAKNLSQEAF
jgi:hypothetical protein